MSSPRPRSVTHRARRIHRWLGPFIGDQFVLRTVGGLHVSWTDPDAVHGDHPMRAFSVLGLVTVGPGFLLFALTPPTLRRRARGAEHTRHAHAASVANAASRA